ncbi:MAG: hypothetical protein H0X24_04780 [Ktedonobacterales bacterium]|nr:hypothetical protein [Ktedonobacterales bacterium]
MLPQEFRQFWLKRYTIPPISSRFRETYPDRWWRLHSLPQAKRYATNRREMHEILARHNQVLNKVLGDNTPFALIVAQFLPDAVPEPIQKWRDNTYPWLQPFLTFTENDEDAQQWQFSFQELRWQLHLTDELLTSVANDEIANILYVHLDLPRLFLPYDGGADIICSSPFECQTMKMQFDAWRSHHPLGL